MHNKENILTRKTLTEKSPEEFSTLIVFGFTERWYNSLIGNTYTVRRCMSEEDMEETGLAGYEQYYKVTKGLYKSCVIYCHDCYRVDALELIGIFK